MQNASLGLRSYCYDVIYSNEDYVIDATASINDPGRHINHASYTRYKLESNQIKLRDGFVAKRMERSYILTKGYR